MIAFMRQITRTEHLDDQYVNISSAWYAAYILFHWLTCEMYSKSEDADAHWNVHYAESIHTVSLGHFVTLFIQYKVYGSQT